MFETVIQKFESPTPDSHSSSLPASARDGIDAVCDRFEMAWRSGNATQIEDHLGAWPARSDVERRVLTRELVAIDLEHRWRNSQQCVGADADESTVDYVANDLSRFPMQPRLEDYLVVYPELSIQGRSQLDLIATEYRVRQLWGDRPHYREYVIHFPRMHADLIKSELRQIALDLTPEITVFVHHPSQLVFSTDLNAPLELGRQQQNEPPAYCRTTANGADRVIVAPLKKTSVSRRHLYLDVVAKDRIEVTNLSTKWALKIDGVGRLWPVGTTCANASLTLSLGDTRIRLVQD